METPEIKTIDLIRNPELLNSNTVDILLKMQLRYPYYQTLRLLLLENLYKIQSPQFNDELKRSALLLADRSVLFNLIEGKRYEIEPQISEDKKKEEDGDRTLSLIDNYLGDKPTEKPIRKIAPSDAAQDYASYLMQMEEEENGMPYCDEKNDEVDILSLKKDERKSARIVLAEKSDGELETPEDDEPSREEFFTETLAQIYIKQHKYERALEIIKALNLNNSKKNGYFADQIRFLEKLISINKK